MICLITKKCFNIYEMKKQDILIQKGSQKLTSWIGSTNSVIIHTVLFLFSFILPLTGIISPDRMLLMLTTIVSLEAIYLSIFIQMSINMNNQNLETIQEDIEEMGENIEEMGENIEEMIEEEDEIPLSKAEVLSSIQTSLDILQKELNKLKKAK